MSESQEAAPKMAPEQGSRAYTIPVYRAPNACRTPGTLSPQTNSLFFSLPLEVRDQIYDEVLGDDLRQLRYYTLGVRIRRTDSRRVPIDTVAQRCGLPEWLLSCKQMCNEALDVISWTHSFEYIGLPRNFELDPNSTKKIPVNPSDPTTWQNALIFRKGSIRHMTLPTMETRQGGRSVEYHCFSDLNEDMDAWLDVVKECRGPDLHLTLLWHRRWHQKEFGWGAVEWEYREPYLFDYLDLTWNGAFRKVEIELGYSLKTGNGLAKMIALAEACAPRLLGTGAGPPQLEWSEEVDKGPQQLPGPMRFTRILDGERKVSVTPPERTEMASSITTATQPASTEMTSSITTNIHPTTTITASLITTDPQSASLEMASPITTGTQPVSTKTASSVTMATRSASSETASLIVTGTHLENTITAFSSTGDTQPASPETASSINMVTQPASTAMVFSITPRKRAHSP